MHPIRRATPDQKGCNAYGSGAAPPTTSPTADTPSPQTPTVRLGRSHTASTCSPRLRTRGAAPVTSRNTRYVALHPIRRGVMPTDRVQRLPRQAQPRTLPPHRPQPSASDAATRPRHAHPGSEREALHPLRRETPVTSRNTRYVAMHPIRRGVMPTDRVHRLPQQAQPRVLPPYTPQPAASDAATRPQNTRTDSAQEPLHPIRHTAPDPSHCTRSVAVHPIRRGVMPTDRVQHHFATSRTAETRLDSSP